MFLQVLGVCLAAFASWLLLRSLIPQLRRRLLDQPNARSSHRLPTPRGGGVVFVVVAVAASVVNLLQAHWSSPQTMAAVASPLPALQLAALSMLALPLALVGFADDRHNLPAGWRYGAQLATALVLLLISPLVNRLSAVVELPTSAVHLLSVPLLSSLILLVAPLLLLLVAVTAVINFTNFMDGLDGLVAGCMAVALAALAIELAAPLSIWALVGAVLGFLIWNWSPAKVFMGDVGSTFLGAVFAGLVLQAPSWPEALAMLLVATPLLADACLCVPRRLLAGQRVFQAHRLHLFQRLHQAGWTHALVSSLYIAATVVLAMALLWGGWPWVIALASFVLLIGVWLDQQVAVPFAVASRS